MHTFSLSSYYWILWDALFFLQHLLTIEECSNENDLLPSEGLPPLYLYKFNYAEDYKINKNKEESHKNINGIINKFLEKKC